MLAACDVRLLHEGLERADDDEYVSRAIVEGPTIRAAVASWIASRFPEELESVENVALEELAGGIYRVRDTAIVVKVVLARDPLKPPMQDLVMAVRAGPDVASKIYAATLLRAGGQTFVAFLLEDFDLGVEEGLPDARERAKEFVRLVRKMHERGVFHGDLKAQNAMVSTRGAVRKIRIIDFGEAMGREDPRLAMRFGVSLQKYMTLPGFADAYAAFLSGAFGETVCPGRSLLMAVLRYTTDPPWGADMLLAERIDWLMAAHVVYTLEGADAVGDMVRAIQ